MTITDPPMTFADKIRRVADHFETSPYAHRNAIMSELHMACGPYGRITDPHDYTHKISLVHEALAAEAGCDTARLSHTLEALDLRTELPDTIRRAAKRIEEET